MTVTGFVEFNIKHALEDVPEADKSYDDTHPPFGVSALSGKERERFKASIQSYRGLDHNCPADTRDVSLISLWHKVMIPILSLEDNWVSWDSSLESPIKKAKLQKLKVIFFDCLAGAAYKTAFLKEHYALLKKITSYYEKCKADLRVVKGSSILKKIGLPGSACSTFVAKFKAYLKNLKVLIASEKEKFAPVMALRLRTAALSKDRQNGDALFYIAAQLKKIIGLNLFATSVFSEAERKRLANRESISRIDPGLAKADLEWMRIPDAPIKDLDFGAFKAFHENIFSLPRYEMHQTINDEPLLRRWTSSVGGIVLEFAIYKHELIILPEGKAAMISSNFPKISAVLRMDWNAIMDLNEAFRLLYYHVGGRAEFDNLGERELYKKFPSKFSSLNDDVERCDELADALNRAVKGIETCWKQLNAYKRQIPNRKESPELTLYTVWEDRLNRALSSFDLYITALVFLFKQWSRDTFVSEKGITGKYPSIRIVPLIKVIKEYEDVLEGLGLALKEKKERAFRTIYKDGVDQIFFQLFIRNLKEDRQEFKIEAKGDADAIIRHNTHAAKGLVQLMIELVRERADLVQSIGEMWLGTADESLANMQEGFGLEVFNQNVAINDRVPHQRRLLDLLLTNVLNGLDSRQPGGLSALRDLDRIDKKANLQTLTLFDRFCDKQRAKVADQANKTLQRILEGPAKFAPQDLLRDLNELPAFDRLQAGLRDLFSNAIVRYAASFGNSYRAIFPILKKLDEVRVKNCARVHLSRLLEGPSAKLWGEALFFEEFLRDYPQLHSDFLREFSGKILEKASVVLKKIAESTDDNLSFSEVCEKVDLLQLIKVYELFFGVDASIRLAGFDSLKVKELVDLLFLNSLKPRIRNWVRHAPMMEYCKEFPLTPKYRENLVEWLQKEVSLVKPMEGEKAGGESEEDILEALRSLQDPCGGWQSGIVYFLSQYPFQSDLKSMRHEYSFYGLKAILEQNTLSIFEDFFSASQVVGNLEQTYGVFCRNALAAIEDFFSTGALTIQTTQLFELYFSNQQVVSAENNEHYIRVKNKFFKIRVLSKQIISWSRMWRQDRELDEFSLMSYITRAAIDYPADPTIYRCCVLYFKQLILSALDENIVAGKGVDEDPENFLKTAGRNLMHVTKFFSQAHVCGFITEDDLAQFKAEVHRKADERGII